MNPFVIFLGLASLIVFLGLLYELIFGNLDKIRDRLYQSTLLYDGELERFFSVTGVNVNKWKAIIDHYFTSQILWFVIGIIVAGVVYDPLISPILLAIFILIGCILETQQRSKTFQSALSANKEMIEYFMIIKKTETSFTTAIRHVAQSISNQHYKNMLMVVAKQIDSTDLTKKDALKIMLTASNPGIRRFGRYLMNVDLKNQTDEDDKLLQRQLTVNEEELTKSKLLVNTLTGKIFTLRLITIVSFAFLIWMSFNSTMREFILMDITWFVFFIVALFCIVIAGVISETELRQQNGGTYV
jgi:hypothetical protein